MGRSDLMIGTELDGRYRILAELGAGGVGTVYRGVRLDTGAAVAIKVLRPELASSPDLRKRFEREAKALASLSHPNVVGVIDSGVSANVAYLVMELLEGETLSARLKRGALTVKEATPLLRELLVALGFAHGRGLVHRDVKPANVFLERLDHGGDARVRLLDFGLAKFLTPEAGSALLTRAGQVFGTPTYMAPEQIAGQEVDARVDVYAAGIVWFEMLAGRPPFRGDSSEILRQHVMDDVPVDDALPLPANSESLRAVLRCATAKTRAGRFENATEMLAALDDATRAEPTAATIELVASPESTADTALADPRGDGAPSELHASAASEAPTKRAFVVRAATTVAILVSLSASLAAALGVYVLMTPGRETERRALEHALAPGASAPKKTSKVVPPTGSAVPAVTAVTAGASRALPVASSAPSGAQAVAPSNAPAPSGAPSTGESPDSATRPPDPWNTVPPELGRLIGKANRPKGFDKRDLVQIHQYNAKHPEDPRGHLLLARGYVMRRWFKDALSEYAIALKVSRDSSGDPRMLKDLLTLVEFESGEASRMVQDVYGPLAVPAIDRALSGKLPNPEAKVLLEKLRADLTA